MADENKMTGADWIPLIAVIIVALLGGYVGFEIGKHRTHIASIRAGVGEFYLPDKEGTQGDFRWKTNTIAVTNTVFILK
jgi:hypothetical protein